MPRITGPVSVCPGNHACLKQPDNSQHVSEFGPSGRGSDGIIRTDAYIDIVINQQHFRRIGHAYYQLSALQGRD